MERRNGNGVITVNTVVTQSHQILQSHRESIWCGLVACGCIGKSCEFNELVSVVWLGDEDIDIFVGILLTVNVEAEEMGYWAIKVDSEGGFFFHSTFEFGFDFVAFAEVDDVVDKEA